MAVATPNSGPIRRIWRRSSMARSCRPNGRRGACTRRASFPGRSKAAATSRARSRAASTSKPRAPTAITSSSRTRRSRTGRSNSPTSQGTGPAPTEVFRGSGRVGLLARDYDLTVDYEQVSLAATAVPTPARARLSRAWNALRGSVARRGWTDAPESRRVQWHGNWDSVTPECKWGLTPFPVSFVALRLTIPPCALRQSR